MHVKNQVPNALTCCNLLSGCLSITSSFYGDLDAAFYWVLLGLVFDFADGFVARLLSASSSIGKELDSLADCITFGLAPACFLIPFLKTSTYAAGYPIIIYTPFLITIFSAIRLAKFNIDTRQSELFIGLPTPANAIFSFSLPVVFEKINYFVNLDSIYIIFIFVLQSYIMNSEIPLISLKFKSYDWNNNKNKYILILISIFSIYLFSIKLSIPVIVVSYIVVSIFTISWRKQ